jgi:hypothetical protein
VPETLLPRSGTQLELEAKPTCAPSRITYKSNCVGVFESFQFGSATAQDFLHSLQFTALIRGFSAVMGHTRSESSGDVVGVKEQRTRKAERLSSGEHRVTTCLKIDVDASQTCE